MEVPVAYIVDEFKIDRKAGVIIMALIIFLAGIPSLVANGDSSFFSSFVTYGGKESATNFMDFLQHVADIMLLLGGTLIVTFAAYVWKTDNLDEEISSGFDGYKSHWVRGYLNFAIMYICPLLLGVLFVLVLLNNFFGISIIN